MSIVKLFITILLIISIGCNTSAVIKLPNTTTSTVTTSTVTITTPVPIVTANETVHWREVNNSFIESAITGKILILFFTNKYCVYCNAMKETTFKNKEVVKSINDNFIPVVIDDDEDSDYNYSYVLIKRFDIDRFPSNVFILSDKTTIATVVGYVDPESYLKIINSVK